MKNEKFRKKKESNYIATRLASVVQKKKKKK